MKECKSGWVEPLSEETAQEMTKVLREFRAASELEEISNRLADRIFEDILKDIGLNEDIMEEKKTKKMTKVKAYVYLNNTKVYVNGKGAKVLEVLSKVGFKPTFPSSDVNAFPFMGILDEQVTYYAHMKQYLDLPQKEISADDILSIEIVEENCLDKDCAMSHAMEIMRWLREKKSPHTTMIIDGNHAELLEGVKSVVWKEDMK